MSLVVLGTVALDHVKTPAGERKEMLGGSAAHFAMSARLFTGVEIAAVVGRDFPLPHLKFLKRKNVNLDSLVMSDGKTFRWSGEYQKNDLNTAVTKYTELGVLGTYIPKPVDHQRKASHVFLANFDPDLQEQFLSHFKTPQLIGLDSMNLWIATKQKSLRRLMKKVDLFVANDSEARALTQENNLIKAAQSLRAMGPEMIVIKKGEHGMLFLGPKDMFSFPAYPVDKVVDPTGAGDTFAGGLMGYLSRARKVDGATLRQACVYATTLASFNVQGFGMEKTAGLSMSAVEQRKKALEKFFSLKKS
ncbi:MAG: bifunctional hydroxymethylpyrimidine kinase/phosphomethylpyrimidine kinase [Candidatus Omnitrophica bacterium]|nr:bifunctional hydroxymethylpyrimidine kinase/phosphomethylpyrimidine kinase [Candidatus Omnitrophota bacterium]